MSTVYVIADQYAETISDHTQSVIEAARAFSLPIVVLVAGKVSATALAPLQAISVVKTIVHYVDPILDDKLPEWLAPVYAERIARAPGWVLMAANTYGKSVLPRLAAMLDLEMVSNVREITFPHVAHDLYAGNIIERIELGSSPVCMSIQASAFSGVSLDYSNHSAVEVVAELPATMPDYQAVVTALSACDHDKPRLDNAACVIGGGRALGSTANFQRLQVLADRMGAAMGGTRAAVDAGYITNHYQIGQTGQVIAPDTYMAFGISGAIQHVAGITASRTIVAVNTDPDAEIFQVADYGLVGDWSEVVTALERHVRKG